MANQPTPTPAYEERHVRKAIAHLVKDPTQHQITLGQYRLYDMSETFREHINSHAQIAADTERETREAVLNAVRNKLHDTHYADFDLEEVLEIIRSLNQQNP